MKSQSLKLYAAAFVLGLAAIFASAGSAAAQTAMTFETSFDFQVGKEKMEAGKYRLQRLDYGRYLLRNTGTKDSVIIATRAQSNKNDDSAGEHIVFNRYGETFFLRRIVDRVNMTAANEIPESNYEENIRKSSAESEEKLARKAGKPARVSVNLNR